RCRMRGSGSRPGGSTTTRRGRTARCSRYHRVSSRGSSEPANPCDCQLKNGQRTGSPSVSVQDMRTVVPIPRQVGRVGTGIVGWLPDSAQRWASYDSALKLVAIVGGPLVGPREVEWRIRSQAASNMRICGHPDGSRFAVVYGSAARIEIHAVGGSLITLGQIPDTTNGEFVPRDGGGGALRWDRTHYRYSGCAATSALVFALYSGQPEGRPEDVAWAGDQVHVLRWDGTFLHTYYLDTR